MHRLLCLLALAAAGCAPSHLVALRAELPPVTDAQTRARLALGHRGDLVGDPVRDLARLRRLAELELALGQPDAATRTLRLAMGLARADLATARGAESAAARARVEETRGWVVAMAAEASDDRLALDALADAPDLAPYRDAIARLGRLRDVGRLVDTPDHVVAALPPHAWAWRSRPDVTHEARWPSIEALASVGAGATHALEGRYDHARASGDLEGAVEAARALHRLDPAHVPAWIALRLAAEPRTRELVLHMPLGNVDLEDVGHLELARRGRRDDPILTLASAWAASLYGQHPDAARLAERARARARDDETRMAARVIVALGALHADRPAELRALARDRGEVARSSFLYRLVSYLHDLAGASDETRETLRELARAQVDAWGRGAPYRAVRAVVADPEADAGLRRRALDVVAESRPDLAPALATCLTRRLTEERCEAREVLTEQLYGGWPADTDVVETIGARGPATVSAIQEAPFAPDTQRAEVRRWLASYAGTEVALRGEWVRASALIAIRDGDLEAARRILRERGALLSRTTRTAFAAALAPGEDPAAHAERLGLAEPLEGELRTPGEAVALEGSPLARLLEASRASHYRRAAELGGLAEVVDALSGDARTLALGHLAVAAARRGDAEDERRWTAALQAHAPRSAEALHFAARAAGPGEEALRLERAAALRRPGSDQIRRGVGAIRASLDAAATPAAAAPWVRYATGRLSLTDRVVAAGLASSAAELHARVDDAYAYDHESDPRLVALLHARARYRWERQLLAWVGESTDATLAARRAREALEKLALVPPSPRDTVAVADRAMLAWLAGDVAPIRELAEAHPDHRSVGYLTELALAREALLPAHAWILYQRWVDAEVETEAVAAWLVAHADADPRLQPLTCSQVAFAGDAAEAVEPCWRAWRLPSPPASMSTRLTWVVRHAPDRARAAGIDAARLFARIEPAAEASSDVFLLGQIRRWHGERGDPDRAAVWRLRELAHSTESWQIEPEDVSQTPYRGVSVRSQVPADLDFIELATERSMLALAEGDLPLAEAYLDLALAFPDSEDHREQARALAYLARDLIAWARQDLEAGEIDGDGLNAYVRARASGFTRESVLPLLQAHPDARLATFAGAVFAQEQGGRPVEAARALHHLYDRAPRPSALLYALPIWVTTFGEEEVDRALAALREDFADDPRLETATLLPEVELPPWIADPESATAEMEAVQLSAEELATSTRAVDATQGLEVWLTSGLTADGGTGSSRGDVRARVAFDPRHSDCEADSCVDQVVPQLTRAGFVHRWTAPVSLPIGEGRRVLLTRGPTAIFLSVVPVGTRVITLISGGPIADVGWVGRALRVYELTFRPTDVVIGPRGSEALRGEAPAEPSWTGALWTARLALEASEGDGCPITEPLAAVADPAARAGLVRALFLTELDVARRRRLMACVDPSEGRHGALGLAAALDPDPRIHDLGVAAVRADAETAEALVTAIAELPPERAASGTGRMETRLPPMGLVEMIGALPPAQRVSVTSALLGHAEERVRALAFASNYAVGDTVPRERMREIVRTGRPEDAMHALHSFYQSFEPEDVTALRARFDAITDYGQDADRRLTQTLSWLLARELDPDDLPRLQRAFDATDGSEDPALRALHNRLDWNLTALRHALGRERSENSRVQRIAEDWRAAQPVRHRARLSRSLVQRMATAPLPEVLPGGHWTYTRVPQPGLFLATLQQLHDRLRSGSAMDTAIARRSIAMMVENMGGELLGPDGGLDLERPVECARSDRFPPSWVCTAYVRDRDRVREILARRPFGTNSGVALQLEVSSLAASVPSIAGALPSAVDAMLHPPAPEEPSGVPPRGGVLAQERSRGVVDLGGVTFERFATFQVREGGDGSIDTEHYLFTGDRVMFFGLETMARALLGRPLPRSRTLAGDRTFRRLTRDWSEGAVLQMANVDVELDESVPMPWSEVSLEMVADGAGITTQITLPAEDEALADVSDLAARLPDGAVARIALAIDADTAAGLATPYDRDDEPLRPPYPLLSRAEGFAFGWYPTVGEGLWDRWVAAVRAGEEMEAAFGDAEIPYPADGQLVTHEGLRYARRGALLVVGTHEADVVATRDRAPGATEPRVASGSLDGARASAMVLGLAGALSADDRRRNGLGFLGAMVGLGRELSFEATVERDTVRVVTRALPNLAEEGDTRLVIDRALESPRNAIALPRRVRDAEQDRALTLVIETSDPELVAARLFGRRRRVRARVVGPRRLEVTVATEAEPASLSDDERTRLLHADPILDLRAASITEAAAALAPADASPAEVAAAVSRFVSERLRYELTSENLDASTILARGRGDCTEHARLAVALLRSRGIPATERDGFAIAARELVAHAWVTYHDGERFREIDPTGGLSTVAGAHVPMSVTDAMALIGMDDLRVVEVRAE